MTPMQMSQKDKHRGKRAAAAAAAGIVGTGSANTRRCCGRVRTHLFGGTWEAAKARRYRHCRPVAPRGRCPAAAATAAFAIDSAVGAALLVDAHV
jgi:hypothetical protein